MHQQMAAALDSVEAKIKAIQQKARSKGFTGRPRWPMVVLRSPKGWTCPRTIDGKLCEGYWRSHQVPMGDMDKPGHVKVLEGWLKSYRPAELFDDAGRFRDELAALAPKGERRMGANPHANGGLLLKELRLPAFQRFAVEVPAPGASTSEATRVQGSYVAEVMKLNLAARNFRVFSPDENASNRWQDIFAVTKRGFVGEILPIDDDLAPDGRVLEMLSEHQCQGWLEGYLLTGRHGFFNCYEAFIHIVDSMFNQHAKWLKVCNHIPWRRPIASLNYLLSSHVWRQDHNGFSHQDPGFIDHVVNKKAEIIRVVSAARRQLPSARHGPLPPQPQSRQRHRRWQQPAPQWLTMDQAIKHCDKGIGIWDWASNDRRSDPDVVMACSGDVPTLETLAAVELLRTHVPEMKIRVVNIVDLMTLQPHTLHPSGLSDEDFDALFTKDRPVVFAFHGYPWLIHRLTLPPHESRQFPRSWLSRGRHDDDAVRHVRVERSRSVQSGRRGDRPCIVTRSACGLRQTGDSRRAHRASAIHHPVWRRRSADLELAMGWKGVHDLPAQLHGGRQHLRSTSMSSATKGSDEARLVSLSDEEAVKEILGTTVLNLWKVVNNLTRLRPSKRERYRVAIFGSARAQPGTFMYEEVKRVAAAFASMGCDIVTGAGLV